MLRKIPERTQVQIVRQVLPVRDLLQAGFCEETPHQIVGGALLGVGLDGGEVALQGKEIEDFLARAGEAEERFRAPGFWQAVDQFDVLGPVVDAAEAVADVFEHGDPCPCKDLCDVLHHRLEWDLEVPVEIARAGVVELQLLAECNQRVFDQPHVVLSVSPQVDEKIVPKSDYYLFFFSGKLTD